MADHAAEFDDVVFIVFSVKAEHQADGFVTAEVTAAGDVPSGVLTFTADEWLALRALFGKGGLSWSFMDADGSNVIYTSFPSRDGTTAAVDIYEVHPTARPDIEGR